MMTLTTPEFQFSASHSSLVASTPWKPESFVRVGLIFMAAGLLLLAFQPSR